MFKHYNPRSTAIKVGNYLDCCKTRQLCNVSQQHTWFQMMALSFFKLFIFESVNLPNKLQFTQIPSISVIFPFDPSTWYHSNILFSLKGPHSLWLLVQTAALKKVKTFTAIWCLQVFQVIKGEPTVLQHHRDPSQSSLLHPLSSGFDHHYRWSVIFNQDLWLLLIRAETSQSAALTNQGGFCLPWPHPLNS